MPLSVDSITLEAMRALFGLGLVDVDWFVGQLPTLKEVIEEALKALFGLGLLAVGWFVGQRIIAHWELKKKQQELDVSTAVQFQQLYGELKEVSRLWRESRKKQASSMDIPKDLRWSLLARGTNAESKYEAVVMKLASERTLSLTQLAALGLFRQACQQLRESIRLNQDTPGPILAQSIFFSMTLPRR